jgi:hypothetical protein
LDADTHGILQSMLLPIMEERTAGASVGDAIIKTISSRIAGGRKELNKEPSRVRSHSHTPLFPNSFVLNFALTDGMFVPSV